MWLLTTAKLWDKRFVTSSTTVSSRFLKVPARCIYCTKVRVEVCKDLTHEHFAKNSLTLE